jgi:hypothetical protein
MSKFERRVDLERTDLAGGGVEPTESSKLMWVDDIHWRTSEPRRRTDANALVRCDSTNFGSPNSLHIFDRADRCECVDSIIPAQTELTCDIIGGS